MSQDSDIDETLAIGYNIMMEAATSCTRETENESGNWSTAQPTWSRILQSQNDKLLPKSINCKGSLEMENKERPNDNDFKEHVVKLLKPENMSEKGEEVRENRGPYIPVLDDPLSMQEFMKSVNGINRNKGYSGIGLGVVQMLPEFWLPFFLLLFHIVFMSTNYPVIWYVLFNISSYF